MFKAQIVADSKNEFGNRLTTFVVTFPRIILAEFNTHRMLSKNSASSRAIPYKKALRSVIDNPFIPLAFQKDHSGMQGSENLDPNQPYLFADVRDRLKKILNDLYKDDDGVPDDSWIESDHVLEQFILPLLKEGGCKTIKQWWLQIRDVVVSSSLILHAFGVTKQICNRLLEPFMWHTVIVTGTEWDNFFGLRVHEAAEIHMQKIAGMMLEEYNKSTPKLLKAGEWHVPYENEINELLPKPLPIPPNWSMGNYLDKVRVKISTVMSARTSYTVVGADQKPMTYEGMIELHDKMKNAHPKHTSPFEHCGQCMSEQEYAGSARIYGNEPAFGWSGNFRGFKQYRKMIEGENITHDARIIKK
jgi:thymidylate synthase ThyX